MSPSPSPRVHLATVSIDGDTDIAALHPLEQLALGERATAKRRREYVAGRRAAHAALVSLLGADVAERVAVLRTNGGLEHGRPRVVIEDQEAPGVYVSISHTESVAIAAAAHRRIGVDVTFIEERSDAFSAEAFAPGELDGWQRSAHATGPASAIEIVARAFAAKEAALKWRGVGFAVPLHACVTRPRARRPQRDAQPEAAFISCALEVSIVIDGTQEEHVLDAWLGVVDACATCIVIDQDEAAAATAAEEEEKQECEPPTSKQNDRL